MPFLLYKVTGGGGNRAYSRLREIHISGHLEPIAKSQAIVGALPCRWEASAADILLQEGVSASDHEIVIDLMPSRANSVSLYRLVRVWGYSEAEWTPVALQLESLFVERPCAMPEQFKENFTDADATRSPVGEFLYLRGGITGGAWSWGRIGWVNGALLWPDAFEYLSGELAKVMVAVVPKTPAPNVPPVEEDSTWAPETSTTEPSQLRESIDESAMLQTVNRLSVKDRAEIVYRLAERAWKRYQSRRQVEWRTAFGVWTALGAGAGLVLTARPWAPDVIDLWAGGLVAIGVVVGFGGFWLPFIKDAHFRDMHTSYFWETWLHEIVGERPPDELRVESVQEGWFTAYRGSDRTEPSSPAMRESHGSDSQERGPWRQSRVWLLHRAQWAQLGVTVLLAALLFGAIWSKYRFEKQRSAGPGGMGTEGYNLEIESATNVRLKGH